jgi:hypothetical protein
MYQTALKNKDGYRWHRRLRQIGARHDRTLPPGALGKT